jgi:hypothetical protein
MNIEAIKEIAVWLFNYDYQFKAQWDDSAAFVREQYFDKAEELAALIEPPSDSSRLLTDEEMRGIKDEIGGVDNPEIYRYEVAIRDRQDAKTARVLEPEIRADERAKVLKEVEDAFRNMPVGGSHKEYELVSKVVDMLDSLKAGEKEKGE